MKALVVGYGSIGARHARILRELGHDTAVVSARAIDFPVSYHKIDDAIATHRPDYVVIANQTDRHFPTLSALEKLDFQGIVLVEKPLFDKSMPAKVFAFQKAYVAYNLRFHPLIVRLKALLEHETVLSVMAYVGQYLPEWRPGTDYRLSYSASAEQGGGVLNDISHELDYLCWLLGPARRVAAMGGKYSALEIDSADIFSLMMEMERCPAVTLQMNYIDRAGRRFVLVNTLSHTILVDFVAGSISLDKATDFFVAERDAAYRSMHQAILGGNEADVCSIQEGMNIMNLIEAAEMASDTQQWMKI